MSVWRSLSRGLRALVNRKATDQEIADEVEQYVENATAAFIDKGLSHEDARRAALLEVGARQKSGRALGGPD